MRGRFVVVWLAGDFETDVADGLLVGGWLAADFETDVADGLLVGEQNKSSKK